MPCVSMVIAAYERPREVVAMLHTLLIQTLSEVEILVVHDGPGEAVRAAVGTVVDPRVRFFETEARRNDWGNSSKAWGSQRATGRYIGHSNDDNYYAPVYLETMVRALETADADFAFCNMIHSHLGYAPLETRPVAGWIDGGGWLCRADLVRTTPWPEPRSDTYADGRFVKALVARCRRLVQVPGFLFVHN